MAEIGDVDDFHAQLGALRANGAADRDPVGFAYLEALIRRATGQPEAIRRMLAAKISATASELAGKQPAAPALAAEPDNASPLTELLAYIGSHAHAPAATMQPIAGNATVERKNRPKSKKSPTGPELKSVAIFRNEWSKLSTEQQLTQTLAQAPENAGPMNSQHLVLRSLERMRDIAPDYLQGFMSYIDTLIWLDHADPTRPLAGRGAGNTGEKKPRNAKNSATKR
jgi:hypothetical protein